MRTKFVETESRYQAKKQCPWAEKVTKVCGGYMCFESYYDYQIWKIKSNKQPGSNPRFNT